LELRLESSSLALFEKWRIAKKLIAEELRMRYAIAYPDAAADPVLHSEQCANFAARILNKEHVLSPIELFILLYALYIHDIGMVSQKPPFVPITTKGEHYKVVESLILQEKWIQLTQDERRIVSYLCRWHNRLEFFSHCSKNIEEQPCDGEVVRVEVLLKIVHICDDYHRLVDIEFFK
jgi:hypothetical protein